MKDIYNGLVMPPLPKQIRRALAAGDDEHAMEAIEVALLDDPWDLDLLEAKARLLMRDQQFDAALTLWRDVAVQATDRPDAHVEKARCLMELGARGEAVEALVAALSLAPELRPRIEREWWYDDVCGDL